MSVVEILNKLGEIDGVVAAIITGVFTFLITKYTYHKNIPLDKMEKAYNRVYYPIYRLLKSSDTIETIVEKCDIYLNKYEKYVEFSTLRAFRYLKESLNSRTEKKAYSNFESNIYAMDTKLRRRLGYMESNVFVMYTFSNPSDKRMIRLVLEVMGIYLPIFIMSYVRDENGIYTLAGVSVLFIIAIIIEFGIVAINFIRMSVIKVLFIFKKWMFKLCSIIKKI